MICLFAGVFVSLVVCFSLSCDALSDTFFSVVFQQGRGGSMGGFETGFIFSYTSLSSFS